MVVVVVDVVVVVVVALVISILLPSTSTGTGRVGTSPVLQSGSRGQEGAGEPLKVRVAVGGETSAVEYLEVAHTAATLSTLKGIQSRDTGRGRLVRCSICCLGNNSC